MKNQLQSMIEARGMIRSAGLFYHSLRLQCMALNLSPFQLRPGPWEIRYTVQKSAESE